MLNIDHHCLFEISYSLLTGAIILLGYKNNPSHFSYEFVSLYSWICWTYFGSQLESFPLSKTIRCLDLFSHVFWGVYALCVHVSWQINALHWVIKCMTTKIVSVDIMLSLPPRFIGHKLFKNFSINLLCIVWSERHEVIHGLFIYISLFVILLNDYHPPHLHILFSLWTMTMIDKLMQHVP